jgi:hypothetical protein
MVLDHFHAAIGAASVDNDVFKIGECLVYYALDGTFQSFAVIEVDGDDGELWHVLSNFMLCSEWQNYIFFSLLLFLLTKMLLSLQKKAEFLCGALHLSDSTSHNVAVRF